MTLREAARELTRIAGAVREVSARLDAIEPTRGRIARDLRVTAMTLDAFAERAEHVGVTTGEPDPDDTSWIRDAAPGEIVEVMGR